IALGAGRRAIVAQLLTESLLLAAAAGALGLAAGVNAVELARRFAPEPLAAVPASLDGRVLAFTIALSALTGIAFGLAPALRASRPDVEASLRVEGPRTTPSRAHAALNRALVVAQVALSLLLLVGASLLVHSFSRLMRAAVGFEPDHVLTLGV